MAKVNRKHYTKVGAGDEAEAFMGCLMVKGKEGTMMVPLTLSEMMRRIRDGDYREMVSVVRKLIAAKRFREAAKVEAMLPVWYPTANIQMVDGTEVVTLNGLTVMVMRLADPRKLELELATLRSRSDIMAYFLNVQGLVTVIGYVGADFQSLDEYVERRQQLLNDLNAHSEHASYTCRKRVVRGVMASWDESSPTPALPEGGRGTRAEKNSLILDCMEIM